MVVGGSDSDKADAITSEEMAAAGHRGRIVFTGAGRTWSRFTAASTCSCCLPTERAFPGRPWRRRRLGLPVIATDIRGCREVVSHGKTGLLVPLYDSGRLATAIEELVVDSALRRRMGTAARQKAEAEFDDRAVVSKTLEAYERVLVTANSSKRRRSPSAATRPS